MLTIPEENLAIFGSTLYRPQVIKKAILGAVTF